MRVLGSLNVDGIQVRAEVQRLIKRGDRIVLGKIGLTPRSEKVLELSVDEARRLGHAYVGPAHILLGLIREGEGSREVCCRASASCSSAHACW